MNLAPIDAPSNRTPSKECPNVNVNGENAGMAMRRIPVKAQFRAVLGSWINVLLIFVPVGFAINYAHVGSPWPTFIINFIAIVPLAAMLSFATEELALRAGETFGGLLNASFGYIYINL